MSFTRFAFLSGIDALESGIDALKVSPESHRRVNPLGGGDSVERWARDSWFDVGYSVEDTSRFGDE
jgi:hypothetical protein